MSYKLIPLNQLVTSAENVRRTDRKADLDSLAASIKTHGLLQNLSVHSRDEAHYEVVAGARRHAALKALAKAGDIAKDFAVPCNIVDAKDGGETSLVENVQRVAMNAMDEADAFAALVAQDIMADQIAQRFGVTTRHVEQRLALSALSPRIKSAYRREEINLDAARAFCIESDHRKQDEVFKALSKPVTSASQVRSMLTESSMNASDRVALLVGLAAYTAAGGVLTRDLFDEDTVLIADSALMTRLANEKLDAVRDELLSAGWGFVETSLGHTNIGSARRIQTRYRTPTRAEKKQLAAIDARIDAIDEQFEGDAEAPETLNQERDELESQRDALSAQLVVWDAEEKTLAGVLIGVDYHGRPTLTYGAVRKENEAKLKQLRAARDPVADTSSDNGEQNVEVSAPRQLSKALTRELTVARADALRTSLIASPDIGAALLAFALLQSWRGHASACGAEIGIRSTDAGDGVAARARNELLASLPEEDTALLQWCCGQDLKTLSAVFAAAAASALDLGHELSSAHDHAKQALADVLADVTDLDMTKHWQADLTFWSRVSKSVLLEAAETAPQLAKMSERRRAKQIALHSKMKRDDLAKLVARTLKGVGWLPEVLITPASAARLALTEAGEAEAAAIAAQ
ncbi:MAG: ParB/RepB/Spo0J family partition protein [Terricaulis sp.]